MGNCSFLYIYIFFFVGLVLRRVKSNLVLKVNFREDQSIGLEVFVAIRSWFTHSGGLPHSNVRLHVIFVWENLSFEGITPM